LYNEGSPLQLTSDEREEIRANLDGDLYHESQFCKYVLLRLDAALSDGGVIYDYPLITIEHVLPQTPGINSQWNDLFPELEKYVHKLGNLVLLTRIRNPKAGNYEFDKKKEVYFKSKDGMVSFHLTTQVINEKFWTPDVVERRQKELLEKLIKIWRL